MLGSGMIKLKHVRNVFIVFVFPFLISLPHALAGTPYGSIEGHVSNPRGKPLPGASVDLIQQGRIWAHVLTDFRGRFRFWAVRPGSDWEIHIRLEHYEWLVLTQFRVDAGKVAKVMAILHPQPPQRSSRTIHSSGEMNRVESFHGLNFTQSWLETFPSPRDIRAWTELGAGIITDLPLQSTPMAVEQVHVLGRGVPPDDTRWFIGGVDVTDPAVPGQTLFYYDFAMLESLEIREPQNPKDGASPGPRVHIVPRSGRPGIQASAHFFWTGKALRSNNTRAVSQDLINSLAVPTTIRDDQEYGLSLAGGLSKFRLVGWVGFSQRKAETNPYLQVRDKVEYETKTADLDARWGHHGIHFTMHWSSITRPRLGEEINRPTPTLWNQSTPGHLYALSDEFIWNENLSLFTRISLTNTRLEFNPLGGVDSPVLFDYATGIWDGSFYWYRSKRQTFAIEVGLHWIRDEWFGGDHDIKVGMEYRSSPVTSQSGMGNGLGIATYDPRWGTGAGEAWLVRPRATRVRLERWAAYIEDTWQRGRIGVSASLRLDQQTSRVQPMTVDAVNILGLPGAAWLPSASSSGITVVEWINVSPRLKLEFDPLGREKSLLTASFAIYPSVLGVNETVAVQPTLRKEVDFWWVRDTNGDGIPQPDEVDWSYPIHWDHPPGQANQALGRVASDFTSPQTFEFVAGLSQKLGAGWKLDIFGTWRRRIRWNWAFPDDPDGTVTRDSLYGCWTQAGTLPSDFGGFPYYFCNIEQPPGTVYTRRPGYSTLYRSLDVVIQRMGIGRLSGFMAITWQNWQQNLPQRESILDPSNWERLNGQTSVFVTPSSGKTQYWMNSRWIVKTGIMVRLPWRLQAAILAQAREGFVFPSVYRAVRPSHGWGSFVDVLTQPLGSLRLPAPWSLNLHLSRNIGLNSLGNLTFHIDIFNLTNNHFPLGLATNAARPETYRKITELMPPRTIRLGISWTL